MAEIKIDKWTIRSTVDCFVSLLSLGRGSSQQKFNAVIHDLLGLPGSDGPSAPGAAGVPF